MRGGPVRALDGDDRPRYGGGVVFHLNGRDRDEGAETVDVEGADEYEWRRLTYVIEMSGERRKG